MGQLIIDRLPIEGLGVEGAADPLQHRGMLGMLGVSDGLQELLVPPDPANVFGRARSLAG